MELCVMIEGQEDVTWQQWLAIAEACERNEIPTLFRSDHYLSIFDMPGRGSLDAWGVICGLAAVTTKLRLGTLVSPASFRHPAILAKLAATADQISGGRIEIGIGAGWHRLEHEAFGIPLLPMSERMEVLAEQLEILTGLWGEGEFAFSGKHYELTGVDALPKPVQSPLPLVMGGNAGPKGAALAARFAGEYNTPNATLEEVRERRATIERAWADAGRNPQSARFSLMSRAALGRDDAEADDRLALAQERSGRGEGLNYSFRGAPERVIEQLTTFRDAGVDRIMIKLPLHDDLEQIDIIGRELAPALR